MIRSYLFYIAFAPLGVDVFLYNFSGVVLGCIQRPLVASAYAALFMFLAVFEFVKKSCCGSNLVAKVWFAGVVVLPLFLMQKVTAVMVGYYCIPLVLLSIFAILKFPSYEEIYSAGKVYVCILAFLVVTSVLFIFFSPSKALTMHELRWADAFYPRLRRVQGVFNGPGVLGLVSAIVASYSCTMLSKWGVFLFVGVLGLFCSDSISAFLAAGCAAMLLYFISRRDGGKSADYVSRPALGVLAGGVMIYFVLALVRNSSYGYVDRLDIWSDVLRSGSGSSSGYSHAHNLLLEVFMYHDLTLQLLSCCILLVAVHFIVQSFRQARVLPIVFGVTVLVYSMFEYGLVLYKLNIAMFSLVLSVLFASGGGRVNLVED